jgi:cell division protein FtsB
MEFQDLLLYTVSAISALLSWFGRNVYEAVRELEKELSKVRAEIPREYVSKSDFILVQERILDTLTRIEAKLDTKQDKS